MTFLILINYEALSLTVAMVIVSEWQIVSDDKFHEMPPSNRNHIEKKQVNEMADH